MKRKGQDKHLISASKAQCPPATPTNAPARRGEQLKQSKLARDQSKSGDLIRRMAPWSSAERNGNVPRAAAAGGSERNSNLSVGVHYRAGHAPRFAKWCRPIRGAIHRVRSRSARRGEKVSPSAPAEVSPDEYLLKAENRKLCIEN
jgi:hypothetical protein